MSSVSEPNLSNDLRRLVVGFWHDRASCAANLADWNVDGRSTVAIVIRTSVLAGIVVVCVALVGLSTVDVGTADAAPAEPYSELVAGASSQALSSLPILFLALALSLLLSGGLIYQRKATVRT